jgi:putative ABC transport system substrate-binding protein
MPGVKSLRRRSFLTLVGSVAVAAVSRPAAAEQAQKVRLIGVLAGFSEADMAPLLEAFLAQLKSLGWTVGDNIKLEARYASGAYEAEQARELLSKNPDVIVTQGTGMLTVVRRETQSVPIVFTMVPDGNVTGFTNFEFSIGHKWLELLKEIQPSLKRVRLLSNPGNPNNVEFSRFVEGEGPRFGVKVSTSEVRTANEIAAAIASAGERQPPGALVVLPDSLLVIHRGLIAEAAAKYKMPSLGPFRNFAENGGLMSYGLNFLELYRQAAGYVDRIFRGENSGDLPIQAPVKFDLIINTKTAKAIGLEVPPLMLARADEVIE